MENNKQALMKREGLNPSLYIPAPIAQSNKLNQKPVPHESLVPEAKHLAKAIDGWVKDVSSLISPHNLAFFTNWDIDRIHGATHLTDCAKEYVLSRARLAMINLEAPILMKLHENEQKRKLLDSEQLLEQLKWSHIAAREQARLNIETLHTQIRFHKRAQDAGLLPEVMMVLDEVNGLAQAKVWFLGRVAQIKEQEKQADYEREEKSKDSDHDRESLMKGLDQHLYMERATFDQQLFIERSSFELDELIREKNAIVNLDLTSKFAPEMQKAAVLTGKINDIYLDIETIERADFPPEAKKRMIENDKQFIALLEKRREEIVLGREDGKVEKGRLAGTGQSNTGKDV